MTLGYYNVITFATIRIAVVKQEEGSKAVDVRKERGKR